MKDKLTVIIVNYNGGDIILECLRRVISQNVSCIVVDNYSKDQSVKAIEDTYGNQIKLIRNTRNNGFSQACNQGLRETQTPYFLLLNPDCFIGDETLAVFENFFARHPQAGLASCMIYNADGSEQRGCRRELPTPKTALARVLHLEKFTRGRIKGFDKHGAPLPEMPHKVNAISGAFMYGRLQAIQDVGFMDEGYRLHCEDVDLCMRYQQSSWEVWLLPNVKVLHFQGQCSQSNPQFVNWHKHRGMARYFHKFFAKDFFMTGLIMLSIWCRWALFATALCLKPKVKPHG